MHVDEDRHRHERLDGVEPHARVQELVDGEVVGRAHHHGVAVGRRLGRGRGADVPFGWLATAAADQTD
jgi:hypothetical protein